jgi:anaerobic magnesium-protoporphyrin IX monomethyl ester cyclase
MKIVIANSIGVDSKGYNIIHSPSRWSEGIKNKESSFTYYPWELAYCSALLKRETDHEVKFVDGCLESLDYKRYLDKISEERPGLLVIESATRMINENLRLAVELKKRLGTKIIFTGPHASVFPGYLLQNGVDFVCIGEYENTVLDIVRQKDPKDISGLYPNKRRALLDVNSLPWPEDKDISRLSYGIPGEPSSEYLEIQMYASRGCPASCTFCVARNVYYACPNWRPRNVYDIINELKYLKNKYPAMEGIFFDEEAHNVNKDFIMGLTKAIIDNKLNNLHYEAMCDSRTLDREMMEAMAAAGYYKIRMGIETTDAKVLSAGKKPLEITTITRKLKEAKETGLKTYGTFMMGMQGSSKKTDQDTISYIEKAIGEGLLDNAQISICTPQPGTPFYESAKTGEYLIEENYENFDGGNHCVVSYPGYDNKSIESVYRSAYRKREHASFLRNFRKKQILPWILRTLKKHGIFKTMLKIFKRIKLEIVSFTEH